jgi:hypothetical protein
MAIRPRSTPTTTTRGVQCRIEDGQFFCDFDASPARVRNQSVEQVCIIDAQTRRWNCPPVPGLHGKPAQVSAVKRDASHGQRWVHVGAMKIPVPVTPVSGPDARKKTIMSSIGSAFSTITRALVSPLTPFVGQRHTVTRGSSVLATKMRSNPDTIHHVGPWGITTIDPFRGQLPLPPPPVPGAHVTMAWGGKGWLHMPHHVGHYRFGYTAYDAATGRLWVTGWGVDAVTPGSMIPAPQPPQWIRASLTGAKPDGVARWVHITELNAGPSVPHGTPVGARKRNPTYPVYLWGLLQQQSGPCLAYVNGLPMVLSWTAGAPLMRGPVSVVEQNRETVHVTGDGIDQWVRRCAELDVVDQLQPTPKNTAWSTAAPSNAQDVTRGKWGAKLRNCACMAPPPPPSTGVAGRRRNQTPTFTSFTAPTSKCCYDAETGRLVCPTSTKLHGFKVALLGVDNPDSATPRARVTMPDGRERAVPICPAGGMQPGSGVPEDCCFDTMTNTLRCPSSQSLDGQSGTVTTSLDLGDGRKGVVVQVADGTSITVPVCRPPADVPPPVSCCVNERTMRIVCDDPSHPWNGIDVSPVASCYTDDSGQRVCFIDISGDNNTILPVCDYPDLTTPTPPEEPPPTVTGCCFRRSTMMIECDDTSSPLHGVVVPEASVSFGDDYADITIGGDVYNRLPLCPEGDFKTPPYTPPPPGGDCPPGQSMTPAGFCDFTPPPPYNPPPPPHDHHDGEPCCDSCARGDKCESTCPG